MYRKQSTYDLILFDLFPLSPLMNFGKKGNVCFGYLSNGDMNLALAVKAKYMCGFTRMFTLIMRICLIGMIFK